ncbi:MAG: flagellar biosynthesis repressor FlbT [Oryzomonas sp.]|uniref:flagellar biosynthesis repressor FlbT n=1 Tax=Oryzomonas sp. TaxID=2855186 RepID=UPI0028454EF7|nr:flagellar biosynthesis repressor FlbT [Oryzomonas sp.]MDR3579528.1 flagellar biosynthesis repressor FlbT [Oryzomonas sp.]
MSLKITLKPHEKIVVGGAVIANGATTCHLSVENKVPVLRQTDIITEAEATTPCRRLYLAVQLMYIDGEKYADILPLYRDLVADLLAAVPSMKDLITQTDEYIIKRKYYRALKHARKLITYEEELLRNVS